MTARGRCEVFRFLGTIIRSDRPTRNRKTSHRPLALAAAAALVLALGAGQARAQNLQDPNEVELDGRDATPAERDAWSQIEQGHYVKARELGERILARDPNSFVANLVLGYAHHYAEDNLPRALYYLTHALDLYEKRYGKKPPSPEVPWRWHAALLHELADVHGDMEHHQEKLAFIGRYNELYEPDMIAERAWPLMKLGRHTEARLTAELARSSERPAQRVIALNALCAIEFEAGNDGASYDACKRAVDDGYATGSGVSAVDLTNLAEASRSLFKLDEAERVALEATNANPSWYGNPWMELAELYVRQGRFGEALASLKRVPEYRMRRPPHVRDADRNELRRALASFLLVVAKPAEAYDMTGRAIAAPERRAHNSRDPAQDRTVLALLDRRSRRVAAQLLFEQAATEPLYKRPLLWAKGAFAQLEARQSAALVEKLQDDDARLVGALRIGTASAAIMPPWLLGELVDVLGPGVMHEALERARKRDQRPGAGAYYDALAAEVAWSSGEPAEAQRFADRALAALGPSEVLLGARVMALAAEAAREQEQWDRARKRAAAAYQRDPGVFRRLEIALPVSIRAKGAIGSDIASMLARSPRFSSESSGLALAIDADRASARVCLSDTQGQVLGCAEARAKSGESGDAFTARAARQALDELFAPRVDLSQTDINSLDGQNLSGRNALESLF